MSKIQSNEEIDLLDMFITIWRRKLSIIIFVLICLVAMFIYKSLNKIPITTIATTEIRPISVYEEAEYKIYNLYMETIRSDYEGSTEINKVIIQEGEEFKYIDEVKIDIDLEINNINKNYLIALFIERLSQKKNLEKIIKKSDWVKRKDYLDNKEYENKISELASSINILSYDPVKQETKPVGLNKNNDSIIIQIETDDMVKWENFLQFLEKEINIQIQERLSQMLNNYINYVKTIEKFKIENIDNKISAALNDQERINLEKKKKILIQDQYVERIQNIFDNSPLAKSDEFYAAQIVYGSTVYNEINNGNSFRMSYSLTGLFSALIAIFVVLIANAIQNRK